MTTTSRYRKLGLILWLLPIALLVPVSAMVVFAPREYVESALIRLTLNPSVSLSHDVVQRLLESEKKVISSNQHLTRVLSELPNHGLWYFDRESKMSARMAVRRVSSIITVEIVPRTLDMIEISVKWSDPHEAAHLANMIAQMYVDTVEQADLISGARIIQTAVPLAGSRSPSVNDLRYYYSVLGMISLIGFALSIYGRQRS